MIHLNLIFIFVGGLLTGTTAIHLRQGYKVSYAMFFAFGIFVGVTNAVTVLDKIN